METVETLSVEEWQEEAIALFFEVCEQHSIGDAVAIFLTTLGTTALDTNTVGQLLLSMQSTVDLMLEQGREKQTKH